MFANRNHGRRNAWGHLLRELDAKLVLFEFKNYDESAIGKDEVDQARLYLTKPMGRLAVVCCNKAPHDAAYRRRNSVFSSREKKVILFVEPKHFEEMFFIKRRVEDPGDLIVDLVEEFYLQHE